MACDREGRGGGGAWDEEGKKRVRDGGADESPDSCASLTNEPDVLEILAKICVLFEKIVSDVTQSDQANYKGVSMWCCMIVK